MGRRRKLKERILSGKSDNNIPFEQTRTLLKSLGFTEDIVGSHYIYRREGLSRPVNIQQRGAKVPPYQVRQIRRMLIDLGIE